MYQQLIATALLHLWMLSWENTTATTTFWKSHGLLSFWTCRFRVCSTYLVILSRKVYVIYVRDTTIFSFPSLAVEFRRVCRCTIFRVWRAEEDGIYWNFGNFKVVNSTVQSIAVYPWLYYLQCAILTRFAKYFSYSNVLFNLVSLLGGSGSAGTILGTSIGVLFGLVFAYSRSSIPASSNVKKALILAGVMWLVLFIVPALKYPANPPAVGNPDTIYYRQSLYVAYLAISGLTALGAAFLYHKFGSKQVKKALIPAIYSGIIIAAYLTMPP